MLTRRALLAALAATPLLPGHALAATPQVFAVDGIALGGTDPVAYFTQAAPMMGDPAHATDWHGATWYFASAEHRAMFLADPDLYAPRYGGYCAYALSKGAIAPTVPEAWTIHEGALYLNFSLRARTLWSEDIPGNIAKADGHWPSILNR